MSRTGPIVVTAGAALLALIVLSPLAWMVAVSFMRTGEVGGVPSPLWPVHPTGWQYAQLFSDYKIGRPLLNSAFVAAIAVAGGLCVTVPAGYALALLRFPCRERLTRVLLFALVIPGQVAMLPLFLLMKTVGLVNSYAGAAAPALASAFSVLFIRQAALAIPRDMLDAARLDGASETRVFLTVALPLLRPAVVTLGLLVFLASWNDFLWPLIVFADQRLFTLPVALAGLSREHAQEPELMMAGAVVTLLPVLALFLVLQRHYLRGVLGGAVKG